MERGGETGRERKGEREIEEDGVRVGVRERKKETDGRGMVALSSLTA